MFKKVVRLGDICFTNKPIDVFCKITWVDGRLSFTGVEGPMIDGGCRGSCGQINMHRDLTRYRPAPGWDRDKIAQFFELWDRWHLNDMVAGSPAQMAALKGLPKVEYPASYYEEACRFLAARGLEPDPGYEHNGRPYAFGSAWLRVEVPAEVLQWLRDLPDADKTPAWV